MPTNVFVLAALICLNAIVVDIVWAYYIRRTGEGKWWQAGIFAAGTIVFGGFTGYTIAHDLLMVIPAGVGAFVGTVGSVYRDAKKSTSEARESERR